MSNTQTQNSASSGPTGDGSAAAGSPAGSTAGSPAGSPGTTAAPSTTAAPGAAPAGAPAAPIKPDNRSRGSIAAERAAAKLAAAKAGTAKAGAADPNNPSTTTVQQAPAGGSQPAGTSTGQADDGGEAGKPKGATADGQGGKPAGSTVTAPQDWPAEQRTRFEALSSDDARTQVLSFYTDMHRGFTHAMTQLAEEKERRQDLFDLSERFERDPKAALALLAKRANVEVYFERPAPEGEIPEEVLKDPKKYADHITAQARTEAEKTIRAENDKRAAADATRQAQQTFQQELSDAVKVHADFGTHRPATMALLKQKPALSVEEAYRLVTFDALVKRAGEGEAVRRELDALKADHERKAKQLTGLPAGSAFAGAPSPDDKHLSPGARAMARAEAKRATRTA